MSGAEPNLYSPRINRVLDYVAENLSEDLSLHRLADIACFSPFHFHRIFKGQTGETLHAFVRRQRLERAAKLLRTAPKRTLTDIALEVGFAASADFSRAFKESYGFPPSRWDRVSPMPDSKIRQAPDGFPHYSQHELAQIAAVHEFDVQLRAWPTTRYVYFRMHDAYDHQAWFRTYDRLFELAGECGLGVEDVVIAGMSPDDPEVTPKEKYRYDLGWVGSPAADREFLDEIARERGVSESMRILAADAKPSSAQAEQWGIGVRELPAESLATLRCQGDLMHVHQAWSYLFNHWLPRSRHEPTDRPAMELFLKLPQEIGWESFDIFCAVPVKSSP